MADQQFVLTDKEREYLLKLLQEIQKEKLVEEHRTRSLNYRGLVVEEEQVIASLVKKLGG
jgi:hypothetical protein